MRRPGGTALPGRTAAITAVISGRTPHTAACTGAASGTTTTSFCARTRAWVVRVGCGTQCVSPASSASTPRSAATSTVPSLACSTARPHRQSRASSACAPRTTTGRTRWTRCVSRRWACALVLLLPCRHAAAVLVHVQPERGHHAHGSVHALLHAGRARTAHAVRAPPMPCAHCPCRVHTMPCAHHAVCALRLR